MATASLESKSSDSRRFLFGFHAFIFGPSLVGLGLLVADDVRGHDRVKVTENAYLAGGLPADARGLNQLFRQTGNGVTAFQMDDGRKVMMCFSSGTSPDSLERGAIYGAQCVTARPAP